MSSVPDQISIQRRTVRTLASAQIFSGLGNGSTLALGSILAVQLSGSEAWAGTVTTAMTLGAAVSAIPLSQFAIARGRRVSLTTGLFGGIIGCFLMVMAVISELFPLLLVGSLLVGLGSAVNLQARFAVTDLSEPEHRGRDLAIVVWAITVGAVLGPNMVEPGAILARQLGIPDLAGPFLISAAGMVTGALIIALGLRPDPLLTRVRLTQDSAGGPPIQGKRPTAWRAGWDSVRRQPTALAAVLTVVAAHGVMVAVMSMTPLHMEHSGASAGPDLIALIGFTISLHIAGMYALSPVMGILTDRIGARPIAFGGLGLLLVAVAVTGFFATMMPLVTVGLVLLGLGWSAATVAGSTLLVSALSPEERPQAQGFSDAVMSLSGALAAAVAGPVMGLVDYPGISALCAGLLLLSAGGLVMLTRSRQPVS